MQQSFTPRAYMAEWWWSSNPTKYEFQAE